MSEKIERTRVAFDSGGVELAAEAPPYLTRRLAELAPRGEVRSYPFTHYEMYRPEIREQVLADQIVFLMQHLLT